MDLQSYMSRAEIPPEKIPDIDLYMDQIITLLDTALEENKRTDSDKIMTKTMINNYSKDGLLKRIKGKKYSKEHILMMLLIYNLKQSMSVQDISRLFEGLDRQISDAGGRYNPREVDNLYRCVVSLGSRVGSSLPDYIGELIHSDKQTKPEEHVQTILALSTISALCQNAAGRMIDEYYPPNNPKNA